MLRLVIIIYSYYNKIIFSNCGANLRIHFPIKLDKPNKIKIGNNVSIFEHCWFNCIDNENKPSLIIGDNYSIGRFANINAYKGVIIRDNVLFGEKVHISDATHNYENTNIPIMKQGARFLGKVEIKEGAWIGSGTVILPGLPIGRNAVVAANAVVTKDVPAHYVARWVPAEMFSRSKKRIIFINAHI